MPLLEKARVEVYLPDLPSPRLLLRAGQQVEEEIAMGRQLLQSWASNKSVRVDDLRIDVSWTFVAGEHRLEDMKVKLAWPSLSAELWPRAIRAANICGVHKTLTEGMAVTVEAPEAESAAIEAPAPLEGAREGRSSAAMAQADGRPRPLSAP